MASKARHPSLLARTFLEVSCFCFAQKFAIIRADLAIVVLEDFGQFISTQLLKITVLGNWRKE